MNQRSTVLLIAILAVASLSPAGRSAGELSEPDHIAYGSPSFFGEPLAAGTPITLEVAGEQIASFIYGSER